MKYIKTEKLEELAQNHKLDTTLVIWGVGEPTGEIITWLNNNGYGPNIKMVVDNFKYKFYKEYREIPVIEPDKLLNLESGTYTILMALEDCVWGGGYLGSLERMEFLKYTMCGTYLE